MKKLIALALGLIMVLSLVACAPAAPAPAAPTAAPAAVTAAPAAEATAAPAPEKKTPVIAFVPKVIGQPWWDYVHTGVDAWAKEKGIEVKYKGPAEIDVAAQVQIMTDVVAQKPDILCFSPLDPAASKISAKKLAKRASSSSRPKLRA